MGRGFALSHVFLLSSVGKSVLLVKKKVPSRSGFSLSSHVVLKTRHANPNIHVRRYYSHIRSPNLSATRLQLSSPTRSNNLILVVTRSYIGLAQSYIVLHPKGINKSTQQIGLIVATCWVLFISPMDMRGEELSLRQTSSRDRSTPRERRQSPRE